VTDCAKLAALYEEYALGVLEGEERAEIERHLARNCPQCMAGVARARWIVAQLSHAAPSAEPPEALRQKVLTAAQGAEPRAAKPERTGPGMLFPTWAWAAAAVLALLTGYSVRQMWRQNIELQTLQRQISVAQARNRALQDEFSKQEMIAAIAMSKESVWFDLMPKDKAMPMVHACWHAHMGLVLSAEKMPPMTSDWTLQVWAMPKSGKPMSIGIFRPDASGAATMVMPVRLAMADTAAIAISQEPAGGSPEPTAQPMWLAAMK